MKDEIRDIVINRIRNEYINKLIYILKELEEQKYYQADDYTKLLYEYELIKDLKKQIDELCSEFSIK